MYDSGKKEEEEEEEKCSRSKFKPGHERFLNFDLVETRVPRSSRKRKREIRERDDG